MSILDDLTNIIVPDKGDKIFYVIKTGTKFTSGIVGSNSDLFDIAGDNDIIYSCRSKYAGMLEQRFREQYDGNMTEVQVLPVITCIVSEINYDHTMSIIRDIIKILESEKCDQFLNVEYDKNVDLIEKIANLKIVNDENILRNMVINKKLIPDLPECNFIKEISIMQQLNKVCPNTRLSYDKLNIVVINCDGVTAGFKTFDDMMYSGYFLPSK